MMKYSTITFAVSTGAIAMTAQLPWMSDPLKKLDFFKKHKYEKLRFYVLGIGRIKFSHHQLMNFLLKVRMFFSCNLCIDDDIALIWLDRRAPNEA